MQRVLSFCFVVADRWIKFEEDVEEGGERWSKPHVATLSLHSLFELRKGILSGTVLLDMTAITLSQIFGMDQHALCKISVSYHIISHRARELESKCVTSKASRVGSV